MKRAARYAVLGGAITAMTLGLVAAGTPALAAPTIFPSHASPHSGVVSGTVITVTGTGAEHSTKYYCAQLIVNPTTVTFAYKLVSVKVVTSNGTGGVTCQQTFTPWQAKDNKGTVRHCPLTTTDKNAGFHCGIGLGDKPTTAKTSDSLAIFTTA